MWLDITVSEIKLPPKIKKYGRPNGAELTVMSLHKKKWKEANKHKPIPKNVPD